MIGTVKRIVQDKGYGFIRAEANGVEYFFHQSGFMGDWSKLEKDINKGREVQVEFDETSSTKGPRAENVSLYVREGQKHEY